MTDMTTATKAGGAVLPVVAWRRRYIKPTGSWQHLGAISSVPPLLNPELGPQETEALTLHAPAQATIDELRAEVEALKAAAQEQALQYLSDNGQWIEETGRLRAEVERLTRERDGLRARIDRAVSAAEEVFGVDAIRYKLSLFKNGRAMNHFPKDMDGRWFAFQRAENDAHIGLCDQIAALKAKQIDVEAVMRLAETMADAAYSEACNNDFGSGLPAAREALRASLLGDGGTL